MNQIVIVEGSYAAVRDGKVVGVVLKQNETQWCFRPTVPGIGGADYVTLDFALNAATRFEPRGETGGD